MKILSRRMARWPAVIVAACALFPRLVWGHHFMDGDLPQTFAQGLLSGLGHPVIGLDHAAFIVAAGFLLALVRNGMWGIVALIAGSLLGAVLHLMEFGLPAGEAGVALSVILVGVLLMARRRIALSWLTGGLAVAGVLHGYAYAESIVGAEAAPLGAYLIGFSLMQFGIATVVFLIHRRLMTSHEAWSKPMSSLLGAVVGVIGMAFLVISMS